MCNHQQQQKQSGEGTSDNFPCWEGLYPDLSGLANQPGETNTSILLGLLGIETDQHSVNMTDKPSPSAPPPSSGSRSTQSNDNWSPRNRQTNCNCNGNHQPDILTLICHLFKVFCCVPVLHNVCDNSLTPAQVSRLLCGLPPPGKWAGPSPSYPGSWPTPVCSAWLL